MSSRVLLLFSAILAGTKGEEIFAKHVRLAKLGDLLLALPRAPFHGVTRAPVSHINMAHHVQWKATKKHERTRPRKSLAEKARKERTRARKSEERDFTDQHKDRPWFVKTGSGEVPDVSAYKPADKAELRLVAQKSWFPSKDDVAKGNKEWVIVDAANARLGRLASEIAKALLGKTSPNYTPGQSVGPYVIVVNAEKVIVTGNKGEDKLYRRHSGRPGGMKIESFKELQARIPERIIEKAVEGMLPHNAYGRELFRQLKVFQGPEHPHEAQKPVELEMHKSSRVYEPWSKMLTKGVPPAKPLTLSLAH